MFSIVYSYILSKLNILKIILFKPKDVRDQKLSECNELNFNWLIESCESWRNWVYILDEFLDVYDCLVINFGLVFVVASLFLCYYFCKRPKYEINKTNIDTDADVTNEKINNVPNQSLEAEDTTIVTETTSVSPYLESLSSCTNSELVLVAQGISRNIVDKIAYMQTHLLNQNDFKGHNIIKRPLTNDITEETMSQSMKNRSASAEGLRCKPSEKSRSKKFKGTSKKRVWTP